MLCYYLRYIDLHAIYEQLPTYEPGHVTPALANIPPALCDTLALYFDDLGYCLSEDIEEWRDHPALDIAAHAGDLIEADIEGIEHRTGCPAPTAEDELTSFTLESLLCFASEGRSNEKDDYGALHSLLIYQYDALCSLHSSSRLDDCLALFESIASTREVMMHCHRELIGKETISRQARARASIAHRETNAHRAKAIERWHAEGHQFSSMRAFARSTFRDFGVTDFTTVYNWLREARNGSKK
jgi:hypothetical protein